MTFPLAYTKVFKPLKVGNFEVNHRIFYPSTTRLKSAEGNIPTDLQLKYYDDRSKFPGTLIVTEGTTISPFVTAYDHAPGIYNDKQVEAWKIIVDKIHANGSFVACQLWSAGKHPDPCHLHNAKISLVATPSSPTYFSEESTKEAEAAGFTIKEFSQKEINAIIISDHLRAAENAFKAGFDIIEIHGYLFDQFLQSTSEESVDRYSGSLENRSRYVLELIDLLISKFGAATIAIRISPWSKSQIVAEEGHELNSIENFIYLLTQLQNRADEGNQLAYVSVVEPRVEGYHNVEVDKQFGDNEFVYKIWKGIVARAGNYTYDSPKYTQILKDVENDRTLIGISRYFTSNPDLILRLEKGLDLTEYDESTFYNYNNYRYNTWESYGIDELSIDDDESTRLPVALV